MNFAQSRDKHRDVQATPHFVDDGAADDVRAWEEIDAGRFMPRRIRGSYKGRALG
jgi:hypothetical protein